MLPIRTILYPTDFSDSSTLAFHLACALARDYGARLLILHVAEAPFRGAEVESLIYSSASDPRLHKKMQQLRPADRRVSVEHLIVEGDPAPEIIRAAHDSQCDVIVMGTHGRTRLGRLLMGSVAEDVVRKAPCPVVMVKNVAHSPRTAQELVRASAGT